MVTPARELVFGAAVEVKDTWRGVCARVARAGSAARVTFHLHILRVAVHRLHQHRLAVEVKPLIAIHK